MDSFFAVPMVLLALTFPVFFFVSSENGRTIGWFLYGAALLLTLGGMLYCALAKKNPNWGGATCAVALVVIGLSAWNRHGLPW
ncbi:hypothetical protein [Streptomyces sp. NPDC054975]